MNDLWRLKIAGTMRFSFNGGYVQTGGLDLNPPGLLGREQKEENNTGQTLKSKGWAP